MGIVGVSVDCGQLDDVGSRFSGIMPRVTIRLKPDPTPGLRLFSQELQGISRF
jgi:hypothetical protein